MENKDRNKEIAELMDNCDKCGHSVSECINSFAGNGHVSPWYEMRCRICGSVWTVYDRWTRYDR